MLPTETKQLLAGPASYNISNSLRFRASASAYLNRTPTVTSSDPRTWTFSAWVKRGVLSATQAIISAGASSAASPYETQCLINSSDILVFNWNGNGAGIGDSWSSLAVFRDPGAWYHILLKADISNATRANRLLLYVNGVQQTFTAGGAGSNSATTNWELNGQIMTVARSSYTAANYFDGYMAEVNFIDGQALTPSSFGFYDPYTGVWMPRRYTGTYTGNSFYLPFINQSSSTFAATFNGSTQYLVTNSVGNALALSNSDFTVEYWMNTTVAANGATLCCAGSGTVSYDGLFGYITAGTLVTYLSSTGGSWDIASNRTVISSIVTGRWYHIAYTRSGSTWRVFVDGTQVDTFTSSASLYQSSNQFSLARAQGTGYFTGLLSNVRVVKGTALYTSNFTPPIQPLTAVTNTQLLTLQSSTVIDNSANAFSILNNGSVAMSAATPFTQPDLTADYSGLGNNWTPNNISLTAGVTYDSMIDVPTNWADGGNGRGNYCVLNALDKSTSLSPTNANLTWAWASANHQGVRATFSPISGLYYFEVIITSSTTGSIAIGAGLVNATYALNSTYLGAASGCWGFYASNLSYLYANGVQLGPSGSAFSANDVLQVAWDVTNSRVWFGKNNVWYDSSYGTTGNPSTGANPSATSLPLGLFPYVECYAQTANINFGQRPFSYTPPTGFVALNSQNLVTPTILNGANYMAATLYTGGNGSAVTVINSTNTTTGKTFQPDFVWIKDRTTAGTDNTLWDVIRGNGARLYSNSTAAEGAMGQLTSLNANGFTVGYGSGQVNYLTDSYVGWQWNAGSGTTSSGTGTGGIANVTQSVNVSAGFSIVKYTGSGTAGATFTHGLGVTPGFFIIKDRTSANDWRVWHSSFASTTQGYLTLNATDAVTTSATIWNSTSPNSSVITVGTSVSVNANTDNYICYAWTPIAGYSSMGSYTGNGSTDGPMVFTGMRSRWVMIKRTDTAGYGWFVYDTSRNTYNAVTLDLEPNVSNAETNTGSNGMDILSNGFKIRDTSLFWNASGGTYIYAAFAENPFKVSRAR